MLWSSLPGHQAPWLGALCFPSCLLNHLASSAPVYGHQWALSFISFGCKFRILASLRRDVSICKREKMMSTWWDDTHRKQTEGGGLGAEVGITHTSQGLCVLLLSPGPVGLAWAWGEPQQSWHLLPAKPPGILQRQKLFFLNQDYLRLWYCSFFQKSSEGKRALAWCCWCPYLQTQGWLLLPSCVPQNWLARNSMWRPYSV